MNNLKKRRLGRGLEALLGATSEPVSAPERPVGSLSDLLANRPMTSLATSPSATAPATSGETDTSVPARSGDSLPVSVSGSAATVSTAGGDMTTPGTRPPHPMHSPQPTDMAAADMATAHMATAHMATAHPSTAPASPTPPTPPTDAARVSLSASTHDGGLVVGPAEGALLHLPVLEVQENPFQPRRVFSESEIASLSESLKEHDMLQPILVRVIAGQYQLISGERRLRAAIQAGWKTIPARVREADDRLVAELAIVENLQRKDLNAIEKALSFRRYLTEHQATQEELAGRLKIDRSTIANLMRILELPESIQEHVSYNRISAGHARAILPLGEEREQLEFCSRMIAEGWSVREAERRVAEYLNRQDGPTVKPKRKVGNPQVEMLETQAKRALGTAVQIKSNGRGAGRMIIHFKNDAEFQRIFEQVCQERGALAKVA